MPRWIRGSRCRGAVPGLAASGLAGHELVEEVASQRGAAMAGVRGDFMGGAPGSPAQFEEAAEVGQAQGAAAEGGGPPLPDCCQDAGPPGAEGFAGQGECVGIGRGSRGWGVRLGGVVCCHGRSPLRGANRTRG